MRTACDGKVSPVQNAGNDWKAMSDPKPLDLVNNETLTTDQEQGADAAAEAWLKAHDPGRKGGFGPAPTPRQQEERERQRRRDVLSPSGVPVYDGGPVWSLDFEIEDDEGNLTSVGELNDDPDAEERFRLAERRGEPYGGV